MSFQEPQWNLIAPNPVDSTSPSDILASVRAQITGSSLYWDLVATPTPGSCLVITPKTGVAPSAGQLHIVLANAITGTTAYAAPDQNTSNATRLQCGLTTASGTFLTHQSDEPFGTGHRWSEYWHCATTTSISSSFIIESEESILFGFYHTNGNKYGVLAGAVLESFESGTGEYVDSTTGTGRMYGMLTGGQGVWSTNLWASHAVFSHSNFNGLYHGGVLMTSGGVQHNHFQAMRRHGKFTTSQNGLLTADGTRYGHPCSFYLFESTREEALGRLRGVFVTANDKGITTYMSGAMAMAYGVGTDDLGAGTGATVLFAPVSGAAGFIS